VGYKATAGVFSASECGAPHQRKRVFIMANRNDTGLERYWRHVAEYDSQGRQGADHAWPCRPGEPQHAWEPPRVVADSRCGQRSRGQIIEGTICARESELGKAGESMGDSESRDGQWSAQGTAGHAAQPDKAGSKRQTQPALGGDAHGTPGGLDYAELSVACDNRTDELRLLGNGVVPATAELAFKILLNELH
jgi:site-specific DNA-cytosine methylase